MIGLERSESESANKTLKVKEVFFDFEGTVVDFQWQLIPAVEECLAELDRVGFNPDLYGSDPSYAHIYNHTLELVRKGKGNNDTPSVMAIIDKVYDKYDADAQTRWNLYPDTLDVLEKLKEKGFRMGIISNIGQESLQTAMDRLGLSVWLEIVISRDDVEQIKPHPEGLIRAARTLEVDPAQSIFIGDSLNDIGAARSAGMLAGFIRGGQDSLETMARLPADLEIDNLTQLTSFLDRVAD